MDKAANASQRLNKLLAWSSDRLQARTVNDEGGRLFLISGQNRYGRAPIAFADTDVESTLIWVMIDDFALMERHIFTLITLAFLGRQRISCSLFPI
jgi:hypothetical protein